MWQRGWSWCLLVSAAFVTMAVPSARGAEITASAGSVTGAKGAVVTVPITLRDATAVGAIHLELVYNGDSLQAKDVVNGKLSTDNCLLEFNASKPGRLVISLISRDGLDGDGVVANAHFAILGQAGGKGPLTLEAARAWVVPKGHQDMPEMRHLVEARVNTEPGEFTITGGWPIWMIVAIAGGALLLLLVLIIVLRRGGKRPRAPARVSAPAQNGGASAGSRFCGECGGPLSASDKFCPGCGTRSAKPTDLAGKR